MLSLIALAVLTPATYSFPIETNRLYDVTVGMGGYIPILGGQENATAKVAFAVQVHGLRGSKPTAVSELKAVEITFNDAKFPIGLESAQEFFPKTTITMNEQGQMLSTDAPDKELPFRLPGLDIKRFPDVTFLPIEFPKEGVEVWKEWTFTKHIGSSDAKYVVTPTSITDTSIVLSLKVTQSYAALEDDAKALTTNEKDAVARVSTEVTGTGSATFDRSKSLVSKFHVDTVANSTVEDLKTKKKSDRRLKMSLDSTLRS